MEFQGAEVDPTAVDFSALEGGLKEEGAVKDRIMFPQHLDYRPAMPLPHQHFPHFHFPLLLPSLLPFLHSPELNA